MWTGTKHQNWGKCTGSSTVLRQREPFLTRCHGQEPVTYVDPRLEEILKDTYRVVLFQEQVFEIAVKIAGLILSMAEGNATLDDR